MTDSRSRPSGPPLAATPGLRRLLERLSRRLTGLVWLHGIGTLLAALTLWLAFTFLADWALHVPSGVRWFHLGVLIAIPIALGWWELVRHLRRRPDESGLALLVERAHPKLHQLLVSSVQLQARRDGSPELVDRVLQDAEREAGQLSMDGVLDPTGPRKRFALGMSLAAAAAAVAALNPLYAGIFFDRLVGGDLAWPQRTHLTLTIPQPRGDAHAGAGATHVVAGDERIEVRVARGTDVPVLVRADGVVPREVTLHFAGGQDVVLGSTGGRQFRTLLRSCQEDLEFHVTGGDDRDGKPVVSISVLEPPDVSGLAIRVEPPTYSGLPQQTVFDQDVEVLAGSRVAITMLPDPLDASGRVRLLPEDRAADLAPAPFPLRPEDDPEAVPVQGLGFELIATDSLRFRFELVDDAGLTNPDPGLFAVHVVADRRPEIQLLAPTRSEVDTVPGGLVGLRARASDDFGVVSMAWRSRLVGGADEPGAPVPLAFVEADRRDEDGAAVVLGGTRIDVLALAGEGQSADQIADGRQFEIEVIAVDNRPGATEGSDPHPDSVGVSAPLRVRIVSVEEFLRRLQDRLARLRLQAAELDELQREKSKRVQELIGSLESDQPEAATGGPELASALSGQRRVLGDAEALSRELAAITESVLYARIDEQATSLLEEIDQGLAEATSKGFQAEAWRKLTEGWSSGRLYTGGFSGQLVGILDVCLKISMDDTRLAVDALDRATRADDIPAIHEELLAASRHQADAQAKIDELLNRLAEWDNFQSVLSLTRDILNRQKSLHQRTKEAVGNK